jgi:hypothetical protein
MTPREFDRAQWAYFEQQEQSERSIIKVAWWTARLERLKTVPTLHSLLHPARALTGDELKQRQDEFEQLTREMG